MKRDWKKVGKLSRSAKRDVSAFWVFNQAQRGRVAARFLAKDSLAREYWDGYNAALHDLALSVARKANRGE